MRYYCKARRMRDPFTPRVNRYPSKNLPVLEVDSRIIHLSHQHIFQPHDHMEETQRKSHNAWQTYVSVLRLMGMGI